MEENNCNRGTSKPPPAGRPRRSKSNQKGDPRGGSLRSRPPGSFFNEKMLSPGRLEVGGHCPVAGIAVAARRSSAWRGRGVCYSLVFNGFGRALEAGPVLQAYAGLTALRTRRAKPLEERVSLSAKTLKHTVALPATAAGCRSR